MRRRLCIIAIFFIGIQIAPDVSLVLKKVVILREAIPKQRPSMFESPLMFDYLEGGTQVSGKKKEGIFNTIRSCVYSVRRELGCFGCLRLHCLVIAESVLKIVHPKESKY